MEKLKRKLEPELKENIVDFLKRETNVKLDFKYEVVTSGELIYSRDEIEIAEFKEDVLTFGSEAEGFKYKFQQEYITGIKEKRKFC